MEQVREVFRIKHYAIRTEQGYSDWIKRYIRFHHLQSREELFAQPESKIEEFLSDLAVNGQVAASTQKLAQGLIPALREHLVRVRLKHQEDLQAGYGAVYLPGALERKYPQSERPLPIIVSFSPSHSITPPLRFPPSPRPLGQLLSYPLWDTSSR